MSQRYMAMPTLHYMALEPLAYMAWLDMDAFLGVHVTESSHFVPKVV